MQKSVMVLVVHSVLGDWLDICGESPDFGVGGECCWVLLRSERTFLAKIYNKV